MAAAVASFLFVLLAEMGDKTQLLAMAFEKDACLKFFDESEDTRMLTKEDVESIQAETGLSVAQIKTWAEHFRFRVPVMERTAFLAQDKSTDQVIV